MCMHMLVLRAQILSEAIGMALSGKCALAVLDFSATQPAQWLMVTTNIK